MAQATALDAIFNGLAKRAAANLDISLTAAETCLRLGLRAQAQCRATLQTLAEIKNPQPVAFVQQANIAHGPQQVNNGMSSTQAAVAHARARNSRKASNELLGTDHDPRLDSGT
jgi:antirestriction protein ArdC